MKIYGILNDKIPFEDTLSNLLNAHKSSAQRLDGKGAWRSSKSKRRIRTSMNKARRQKLKIDLRREFNEETNI